MSRTLLLVLLASALAGCAEPEAVGRQLCFQQCEREQTRFEACRARCREAYRAPAS